MKRIFLAAIMMFITLALTGCGDDDHEHGHGPPPIVTDIFSEPTLDGYIVQNPLGGFTIIQDMTQTVQTVQSVFAGKDPVTGSEFRAFLDFSLTDIPVNATIESAILDIVINSIQPLTGTIPIRIDLVDFQQPLVDADFSSTSLPALAAITAIPIFQTDISKNVSIDVTSLMSEAQRLVLANFQIRILLDLSAVSGTAVSGRIEIDDTTGANRVYFAPLLRVTYF